MSAVCSQRLKGYFLPCGNIFPQNILNGRREFFSVEKKKQFTNERVRTANTVAQMS